MPPRGVDWEVWSERRGSSASRAAATETTLRIQEEMIVKVLFRLMLVAGCAALLADAALAQNPKVTLTLENGRVTLVTKDATPAEIMQEWARVTGANVVNGERLTGAPLTLTLNSVSEREALDAVLRSAAGYMVAERAANSGGGPSLFDRILIMPTSSAPAGPATAGARAAVPTQPAAPVAPVVQPGVVYEGDPALASSAAAGEEDAEDTDEVAPGAGQVPSPTATSFDYANPQKYFEMRQQQIQQQQAGAAGAAGVFVPTTSGAAVAVVGGSAPSSAPGSTPSAPTTAPQPGFPAPTPGQSDEAQQGDTNTGVPNPRNPYGLPDGVVPGSQAAPNTTPDRTKYFNPYLPTAQPPQQPPQPPPPDNQ
jgi:hypothetical protein